MPDGSRAFGFNIPETAMQSISLSRIFINNANVNVTTFMIIGEPRLFTGSWSQ